jgi:hypothetical protein
MCLPQVGRSSIPAPGLWKSGSIPELASASNLAEKMSFHRERGDWQTWRRWENLQDYVQDIAGKLDFQSQSSTDETPLPGTSKMSDIQSSQTSSIPTVEEPMEPDERVPDQAQCSEDTKIEIRLAQIKQELKGHKQSLKKLTNPLRKLVSVAIPSSKKSRKLEILQKQYTIKSLKAEKVELQAKMTLLESTRQSENQTKLEAIQLQGKLLHPYAFQPCAVDHGHTTPRPEQLEQSHETSPSDACATNAHENTSVAAKKEALVAMIQRANLLHILAYMQHSDNYCGSLIPLPQEPQETQDTIIDISSNGAEQDSEPNDSFLGTFLSCFGIHRK